MGCASSVWSDEYACIRRNRVRRAKPDKRAWAVLSKDRSRGVVRPAAEGEDTAPGGDDAAGGACLLTGPIRSVGGYEMKDRRGGGERGPWPASIPGVGVSAGLGPRRSPGPSAGSDTSPATSRAFSSMICNGMKYIGAEIEYEAKKRPYWHRRFGRISQRSFRFFIRIKNTQKAYRNGYLMRPWRAVSRP